MAPPPEHDGGTTMNTPDLSRFIGIALFFVLIGSIGYLLVRWVEAWNTRPVSLFDHKVGRWRAHSLQGKPWKAKRHGKRLLRYRRPLERRSPGLVPPTPVSWNDPLLEPHPSLEQPVTEPLERPALERRVERIA